MDILLAFLPIAIILFLMVGLRWGAAQAGGVGYLTALLIAVLFFGAGPLLLAYAHARAFLLSIDVLYIIWAAFLLYRVADEAGAIAAIGSALPRLTADRGMQALIIGWAFASFLQGVGGFGVPVAVIAPILVSLGFTPLASVLIPSIGHGWSVTFGSLGSSFQALMSVTGLSAALLTPPAALFLSLSGLAVGFMVVHAACGWQGVRRLILPVLILGFSMGTVHFLVARAGFWNIGSFSGGMAGLAISLPLARRFRSNTLEETPTSDQAQPAKPLASVDRRILSLALAGYGLLVIITLAIQLIPVLKNFLGQVYVQVNFPEVTTSLGYITPAGASRKINIFSHAGATLLYTSLLIYGVYRLAGLYKPGAAGRIAGGTLRRVMSSSVSIASMVAMALIMENSGMTDTLARGIAEGTGVLFPALAPWIGALGAFMTGSNTNSNVVFGALQLRTAQLLGFAPAIILGAQTAGAALASVMAPTKIVVGASTAGMAGREGEVLRRLLIYSTLLVLLVGGMTMVAVLVGK